MIRKKIIFFALLVTLLFVLSSCGRRGDLNPNAEPIIYITSYGGVDSLVAVGDSIIFQQTVYWEAYDSDGWVEAFAFRILNEDGMAISTPGKEYIVDDENSNGMTDLDEGWVLHYEAGADETIPLSDPFAQKTIWTEKVRAEINFPANGEQLLDPITGDPLLDENDNYIYSPVTSIFEIKCIDDRGDESQIFRRYFKSTSKTPAILGIESTQGPIDGKRIGTGVVLKFRISDKDPLIGDEPNYFLFKLQIINTEGDTLSVANGGYSDEWYSTLFQDDVTEFMLIPEAAAGENNPGPYIINNTPDPNNEDAFLDSTFLTVIAYDLAGIPSQSKTISFAVKEGFYPGSLIYCGFDPNGDGLPNYTYNDIFAIGKYHYSFRKAEFVSSIDVPEEITANGYHYAIPLWMDRNDNFTAINSPNLKIYMHWGFQGEYGVIGQATTTVTNSPFNQRVGIVLDENTQEIYFSELKYFDLQLDGVAYHYPPLAGVVETYNDSLGGWTRIPVGADIDQNTILFNLESGEHTFRVRAVDLSNIGDPSPAEMKFIIVDPVEQDDKSGILIIDDDANSNLTQDALLDSFYMEALSDFNGTIDTYDLRENSESAAEVKTYNSLLHFDLDPVCPIDIQNYKLIIYHSDKAGGGTTGGTNFQKNNDCLNIFFQLGGNILVSLGDHAYTAYNGCNNSAFNLLEDNFGIPIKRLTDDPEMVVKITDSNYPVNGKPFLIQAAPVLPITAILDLELRPDIIWDNLVNMGQGLGACSYFVDDIFESNPFITPPMPIYSYVCKDTSATVYPPTQADYDRYNNKIIGIKHTSDLNTNYMFGFALPYMEVEDVKAMFNEILADLGL